MKLLKEDLPGREDPEELEEVLQPVVLDGVVRGNLLRRVPGGLQRDDRDDHPNEEGRKGPEEGKPAAAGHRRGGDGLVEPLRELVLPALLVR